MKSPIHNLTTSLIKQTWKNLNLIWKKGETERLLMLLGTKQKLFVNFLDIDYLLKPNGNTQQGQVEKIKWYQVQQLLIQFM